MVTLTVFIVIFCTTCIRLAIFDCNMVERQLAGAVHVGAVQGAVAHAVYRFRSLPSSEYDRRLADHRQHVDRRHVLRAVRRTHDHRHPVVRHLQTTLPREGPKYYSLPSYVTSAKEVMFSSLFVCLLAILRKNLIPNGFA